MAVFVVVQLVLEDDALATGWDGNADELAASVKATLHELIGDDDMPYVPSDVKVDVKERPGV